MSLFSFLAEAGEKVSDFISGSGKTEDAISERIKQLGLKIENLKVDVQGDKATLTGDAGSQDILEKAILAAGNLKGIAHVDSQLKVAASPSAAQPQDGAQSQATGSNQAPVQQTATVQPTFYQVKSGDNLSKISKQFYGDANRYNEIFEANKPMLSSPDKIYPGQSLRIPNAQKQQQAA